MLLLHGLLAVLLGWLIDGLTVGSWLLGFVAGYLLLRLAGLRLPACRLYAMRVVAGTLFVPWFAWKILAASLDVARLVLDPRRQAQPAVIAARLQLHDRRLVTVVSCLLTLTPGTLVLEYVEEDGLLYVHVLDARSAQPALDALAEIECRLMAWVWPLGDGQ